MPVELADGLAFETPDPGAKLLDLGLDLLALGFELVALFDAVLDPGDLGLDLLAVVP
jgi:hypothetical protein